MTRPRLDLVVLLLVSGCGGAPPPAPVTQPVPPVVSAPPTDPAPPVARPAGDEDPYLWLEEVTADRSLDWVKARNTTTVGELEAVPGFAATRDRIRSILDSHDKLPFVS